MAESIKRVGVIGAGAMGCGVAHVSAIAGYDVHLIDIGKQQIERGLATINGNLARQVTSGKLSDDERKKALKLITASTDLQDLASADIVIEAITEDEAEKRALYARLCA